MSTGSNLVVFLDRPMYNLFYEVSRQGSQGGVRQKESAAVSPVQEKRPGHRFLSIPARFQAGRGSATSEAPRQLLRSVCPCVGAGGILGLQAGENVIRGESMEKMSEDLPCWIWITFYGQMSRESRLYRLHLLYPLYLLYH
jgi:hypothetical protein